MTDDERFSLLVSVMGVERIRTLCLALPEVTVRVDGSLTRTRSTAQSFDIRRRSFCLLVA